MYIYYIYTGAHRSRGGLTETSVGTSIPCNRFLTAFFEPG